MRLTTRKGVAAKDVLGHVEAHLVQLYDGNVRVDITSERSPRNVTFVLRCNSSRGPGARRTQQGRRSSFATWDVHREALSCLFDMDSGAVVRTALITYRGREDFKLNHAATRHYNVGSMMKPCEAGSL